MADGITRIAVEGFKSIAKRQEIEIAPAHDPGGRE